MSGLPELTGSEKQIVWAQTICAETLPFVETKVASEEAMLEKMLRTLQDTGLIPNGFQGQFALVKRHRIELAALRTMTDSRFWINHRDDATSSVLAAAGDQTGRSRTEIRKVADVEVAGLLAAHVR